MARTRIKFCGIARPCDAVAAAAAGADAIGLIFYSKSVRCVTIEQAREIVRVLPPMVLPVALFVNSTVEEIEQIAKSLNIRTVQLHGDEPPEILEFLKDFTVIKAVKYSLSESDNALARWTTADATSQNLAGILLETAGTTAAGGSGIENDWAGLDAVFQQGASLPPLIAAGGLTPENVGDVVRRLRPFAVDVSTGIEESPGVKSAEKMNRFARQVCEADQGFTRLMYS